MASSSFLSLSFSAVSCQILCPIWMSFSRRFSRDRFAAALFFRRFAQYCSSLQKSGMNSRCLRRCCDDVVEPSDRSPPSGRERRSSPSDDMSLACSGCTLELRRSIASAADDTRSMDGDRPPRSLVAVVVGVNWA